MLKLKDFTLDLLFDDGEIQNIGEFQTMKTFISNLDEQIKEQVEENKLSPKPTKGFNYSLDSYNLFWYCDLLTISKKYSEFILQRYTEIHDMNKNHKFIFADPCFEYVDKPSTRKLEDVIKCANFFLNTEYLELLTIYPNYKTYYDITFFYNTVKNNIKQNDAVKKQIRNGETTLQCTRDQSILKFQEHLSNAISQKIIEKSCCTDDLKNYTKESENTIHELLDENLDMLEIKYNTSKYNTTAPQYLITSLRTAKAILKSSNEEHQIFNEHSHKTYIYRYSKYTSRSSYNNLILWVNPNQKDDNIYIYNKRDNVSYIDDDKYVSNTLMFSPNILFALDYMDFKTKKEKCNYYFNYSITEIGKDAPFIWTMCVDSNIFEKEKTMEFSFIPTIYCNDKLNQISYLENVEITSTEFCKALKTQLFSKRILLEDFYKLEISKVQTLEDHIRSLTTENNDKLTDNNTSKVIKINKNCHYFDALAKLYNISFNHTTSESIYDNCFEDLVYIENSRIDGSPIFKIDMEKRKELINDLFKHHSTIISDYDIFIVDNDNTHHIIEYVGEEPKFTFDNFDNSTLITRDNDEMYLFIPNKSEKILKHISYENVFIFKKIKFNKEIIENIALKQIISLAELNRKNNEGFDFDYFQQPSESDSEANSKIIARIFQAANWIKFNQKSISEKPSDINYFCLLSEKLESRLNSLLLDSDITPLYTKLIDCDNIIVGIKINNTISRGISLFYQNDNSWKISDIGFHPENSYVSIKYIKSDTCIDVEINNNNLRYLEYHREELNKFDNLESTNDAIYDYIIKCIEDKNYNSVILFSEKTQKRTIMIKDKSIQTPEINIYEYDDKCSVVYMNTLFDYPSDIFEKFVNLIKLNNSRNNLSKSEHLKG